MAVIVDIAVSVASKVAEYLVAPVGRQCGYVIFSNSYVGQLKEELDNLENARRRVQDSVDVSENNMKLIQPDVKKWVKEVETVANKACDVLNYNGRAKKTCLCRWPPNPKERYCLGRDARKTVLAIQKLIPQGKFDIVHVESPPPGHVGGASNVNSLAGNEGDTITDSRASIFQGIMKALDDEKLKVIGVYGPGGVGKTTLLEEVEKKLRKEGRPFHMIVKAKVSQIPVLKNIQDEIADALKLDLKGEQSESGRGNRLLKRLQRDPREKILIILDDLWEELDLKVVGIPSGDVSGKCKLLLTSRFKDVLEQKMCADRTFFLEGLSNDEAFRLFEKTVGDRLKDEEELKAIATQVVKKLTGLPLLIISIANTLKNSGVSAWKNALIKIDVKKMETIVKLSYDHLESEDAKSLFLLCGLIGGTIKVELLLGLGMGLGLFEGFNKTIQDARDRLNTMLDSLHSICLLQDRGDDKENVTIHDLYSEVVVSIPFRGQNSLMMNSNYGSWPKEKLEKCWAICLADVGNNRLAELMLCQFPDLKMLILSQPVNVFWNPLVGDCSRLDFTCMKELQVLYLHSMRIASLHSSIDILRNLRSLYLNRCDVEDVTILGKLKALQILSFVESRISKLPKEIGELTNLRSLTLSNCYMLKIIEPGALKHLTNLEELHMMGSFYRWTGKDQIPSKSCNARLAELKSLKKLTALEISVLDPTILLENGDMPFGKLNRFWINIGNVDGREFEGLRTMKLKLEGCDSILSKEWVQKTLQKTQYLHLDGLRESKKNAHELCIRGFPQLKHLDIQNCPSIKYIANSSNGAFTILESLSLKNLINLEKICHGLIAPGCFSKLKVVSVEKCNGLKNMWFLSEIQKLVHLEEIRVNDCDSMRAIVIDDAGEDKVVADDIVDLPNVRHLELRKLPNMMSFCSGAGIKSEGAPIQVSLPRLESLVMVGLLGLEEILFSEPSLKYSNLKSLEIQESKSTSPCRLCCIGSMIAVSFPCLESLVMVGLLDLEKILYGQPPLEYSNLKSIEIRESRSKSSFFKSDWILRLPNLESMKIESSPSAEAVFDLGELKVKRDVEILSRLMELTIWGSPNLRCMWKQDVKLQGISVFRSLKKLKVSYTGLAFLFPVSVAKCLREIRVIDVVDCPNMKAVIVDDEERDEGIDDTIEFPLLEGLSVRLCPIEKFFSYPHGNKEPVTATSDSQDAYFDSFFDEKARFPNIRNLDIEGAQCKELWNDQIPIDSFCKLKSLELKHCDNLQRIAPSRMWKRLQHYLETLEVYSCHSIEIIFESDGYAEKNGNLRILILWDLDKLRHIWQYDGLPKGGEIRYIDVRDCPNMKAVIVDEEGRDEGIDDMIEFPLLESLYIICCPTDKFFSYPRGKKESITSTSDSQDAYSDSFFNPKVSLPSLKKLYFYEVGSFKRIWHGDLPRSSFCELATLILTNCSELLNIFPSTIIGRSHNLNSVEVKNCPSLESLFDCGSLDANTEQTTALLPKLEEVRVWKAGKLRSLVKGNSQMIWGFPSLKVVSVDNCPDMKYLFPNFTASTLEKVERIDIRQCEQMKEVVPEEEGGRSKADVMTFPSLGHLSILQCPNFGAFIRSPTSVKRQLDETAEENDESPQPLFNEMVTFPNIRELEIKGLRCKELWNNQIPTDSFWKLESLKLKDCDNLQHIAPSHMWKRLQRCLEILKVISCRSIEIIYEGDGTDTESGKLRRLVLRDLENLRHIWQSDGLPNVPFPNLRDIKAVRCSRLEMLFATFTAEFLGQIEELVVESCGDMELIAGHEKWEEATGMTITFSKLTVLRLFDLPKFRGFLPEKYSLKSPYSEDFPSLRDLSIVSCGVERSRTEALVA